MATPVLTKDQLNWYVNHIHLPKSHHPSANPASDLHLLSLLQAYHISSIPYENLALQYAKQPGISIDVQEIHQKFLRNGRGGYCMENNLYFNSMLRAFGFQVYLTAARLFRPGTGWSGCEHAVNLVTLSGKTRYLVDVGYGGHGPRQPLPLTAAPESDPAPAAAPSRENSEHSHITRNIGTQDLRLLHTRIEGLSSTDQRMWVYQFRHSVDREWISGYTFTESEFFVQDFAVMNFFTSAYPTHNLLSKVLVVKFLREGDEVVGKLVLENERVRRYLGGKNEEIRVFRTEEERVEGLQELFGIVLEEEEKRGIEGRVSQLK